MKMKNISMFIIVLAPMIIDAEEIAAPPFTVNKNQKDFLLLTVWSSAVCCNQKITANEGWLLIDLNKCDSVITCNDETDLRIDIETSNCNGLVIGDTCHKIQKTKPDEKKQVSFSIICLCTRVGTVCDNYFNRNETCKDLEERFVKSDGNNFVFLKDGKDEWKSYGELVTYYAVAKKSDYKRKVEIKSAKMVENKLTIEVNGCAGVTCEVIFHKRTEIFKCESEKTLMSMNLEIENENDEKRSKGRVTVLCGASKADFWLFRSEQPKLSGLLESHSTWRSHSRTIGTLLIVDLSFGYITIYIVIFVAMLLFNIANSLWKGYGKMYASMLLRNVYNKRHVCPNCSANYESVYDAKLHIDNCHDNICVYCGDEFEMKMLKEHVKICSEKERKLKDYKRVNKESIKSELTRKSKHQKLRFINSKNYTWILTKRIWIISLIILTVLLIIAPAGAELDNKPCSRLMGKTRKCNRNEKHHVLQSSQGEHIKWSSYELGLLDIMEIKNQADKFAYAALHRLKTEGVYFSGNSEMTISGIVKSCTKNTCKTSTDIKMLGDIAPGFMQTYRLKNDKGGEQTLNLFIVDVEMTIPTNLLYQTSEWDLVIDSKFSCTDDSCNNLCPETKGYKKLNQRQDDTSWSHNPSWCFSINQGCSCVRAMPIFVQNSPIYSVYELKKPTIKFLMCLEYGNMYIDCEKIDKKAVYNLKNNKFIFDKIETSVSLPKHVIVKGSDQKKLSEVLTGNICPVESCEIGEFGDFQFNNITDYQNGNYYLKFIDIKSEILYSFAKTPSWEVTHARAGAYKARYYENLRDTNEFAEYVMDVDTGILTIKGKSLGTFSLTAGLMDIEVYEIQNDIKVEKFEVKGCAGEYMSEVGVICTFYLKITGSQTASVSITSGDDQSFVQNDLQTVIEGENVFRKFMYVRSKQASYSYCVKVIKDSTCASFKYNLTDPHHEWHILPDDSSISNPDVVFTKCDHWFGLQCAFEKIMDFFKTAWSSIWIFVGGLIAFIGFLVLQKVLEIFENSSVFETKKMDRSSKWQEILDLEEENFGV